MIKVVVNQRKCSGAGICVQQLPRVFFFQVGTKKGTVRDNEYHDSLAKELKRVARLCPNKAIEVTDEASVED